MPRNPFKLRCKVRGGNVVRVYAGDVSSQPRYEYNWERSREYQVQITATDKAGHSTTAQCSTIISEIDYPSETPSMLPSSSPSDGGKGSPSSRRASSSRPLSPKAKGASKPKVIKEGNSAFYPIARAEFATRAITLPSESPSSNPTMSLEPSVYPSSNPSFSPSTRPTSTPSKGKGKGKGSDTPKAASCSDDPDYLFKSLESSSNEKTKSCKWLQMGENPTKRTERYCALKKKVRKYCKETCGTCDSEE